MRLAHRIGRANDAIAIWVTRSTSSMWMAHAFMMLGLAAALPFIPAAVQRLALVVSTAIIQLWMLPVLQVGTKIFSKSSEKRAIEDHRMLMEELAKIREMEALIAEILATQKRIEGLVSQRGAMQK